MKVIKRINNNYAVALDENGKKLIIYGRGVGFPKAPYELNENLEIQEKYYTVDSKYIELLDSIDDYIFDLSEKIVEIGRKKIHVELNPSIVFTLADHLNFAMYRYDNEIDMHNPMNSMIQVIYPVEASIGEEALQIINKDVGILFPEDEASAIALHFVNAENGINDMYETAHMTELINHILSIISKYFDKIPASEGLDYSRFVLHMRYLIVRRQKGIQLQSENGTLYEPLLNKCHRAAQCVSEIVKYLESECDWNLNEEEQLYLLLHVNRLIKK